MNYSLYRFTLDLQRHQSNISVPVFQYDSAVRLIISLTDGGKRYLISKGCHAIFYGKRPDGVPLCLDCEIPFDETDTSPEIVFEFNNTVTAELGNVSAQIRLFDSDNKIITAPKFLILVEERVVGNEDIEMPDSTIEAIDKILENEEERVEAEEARESAEAERVANETLRIANEAERVDSEIERVSNEDTRVANETERVSAETERSNAETARITAETNRNSKEVERQDLENLREQHEVTRVAQENARVSAEEERVASEKARAVAEEERVVADEERRARVADEISLMSVRYTEHSTDKNAHSDIRKSLTNHNTATDAHNDIRLLLQGLSDRINALHDSDDETLDQTKEIVAYIKANRGLIESITTSKVNVDDIIKNLTTNVDNKPLAASQGVVLKSLIDSIYSLSEEEIKKLEKALTPDDIVETLPNSLEETVPEEYKKRPISAFRANTILRKILLLQRDLPDTYVAKEDGKGLSRNDFTDELKKKLDGIDLSGYVQKDGDKVLSDNNFTDADKQKLDGLGEGGGSASIDEKYVEIGDQVTAKGDYSAAFNKGLIGTEAKASIKGYEIELNEIFKNGVDIVAVDTTENTLDIYGTYAIKDPFIGITLLTITIATAFEYAMGANPHFMVEIANTNRLPVISSEKVTTNGKECARIHIHKSYSVSGVTTSQKVTNVYAGYADAEGSMVVNKLNITLGRGAFSSGYNNLNIADNTHTQNSSNIASGEAGSASGSLTEAGVTAFSTGHRTKALGESSLTFGIRSETAYTVSKDKEGGKGSIAGGYASKTNAPYSAALGYETRTDRQGQLTCGAYSKEDTEAMFIVGAGAYGAPDNAFKVNADGAGYFKGDVYAAGLKLVSQLDVNKSIANQPVATTTNAGLMTPLDKQRLNAAYDAGHVDLTQYYTKDEVDGKIDGITIPESPISQGAGTGAAYMGDRTSANANYSFSGGETSSTATGAKACLAFGISAEARANGSSAFGYRTIANSDSMTVVGRCNDYSKLGAALFVVGNGTSDTDRANAFYVHSNGNTYINGDLYYKNRKAYTELTEIQGQLMIQMTGYRFVVSFSFILNQRVDSITNWSQLRSYIDSRGWLNLSGWGVDQYSVNLVPLRLRKISSGWVIDVVYADYGYSDTLPPEKQISIQDSYVKSCSVHCYPL